MFRDGRVGREVPSSTNTMRHQEEHRVGESSSRSPGPGIGRARGDHTTDRLWCHEKGVRGPGARQLGYRKCSCAAGQRTAPRKLEQQTPPLPPTHSTQHTPVPCGSPMGPERGYLPQFPEGRKPSKHTQRGVVGTVGASIRFARIKRFMGCRGEREGHGQSGGRLGAALIAPVGHRPGEPGQGRGSPRERAKKKHMGCGEKA